MPNQPSDCLYVYYKLAEADLKRARAPAQQVLDAGRPFCERATLLGRPQLHDGLTTWMEAYDGASDIAALEAALERALAASGLTSMMVGPRRSEWFRSLPES